MKINKTKLEIYSKDGKSYLEYIDSIYVRIAGYGAMGFLKNSAPVLARIDISHFYFKIDNKKTYFAISGGIIDVKPDKIVILADTFERYDEIDEKRAYHEKIRAEKELLEHSQSEGFEYNVYDFSLKKAVNRLELIRKMMHNKTNK